MDNIEKQFFKIITGYDYDPESPHMTLVNDKIIPIREEDIRIAQACARKYEEGLREAWRDGYDAGYGREG